MIRERKNNRFRLDLMTPEAKSTEPKSIIRNPIVIHNILFDRSAKKPKSTHAIGLRYSWSEPIFAASNSL